MSKSLGTTPLSSSLHTVLMRNLIVALSADTMSRSDIDDASSDNCGIASSELILANANVNLSRLDCAAIDTFTVTLRLLDATGNAATCSSLVTVKDASPPVVTTKCVLVEWLLSVQEVHRVLLCGHHTCSSVDSPLLCS